MQFEEQQDALMALEASSFYLALWDFKEHLRSEMKYGKMKPCEYKTYETLQQKFFEILEENNVNLNKYN